MFIADVAGCDQPRLLDAVVNLQPLAIFCLASTHLDNPFSVMRRAVLSARRLWLHLVMRVMRMQFPIIRFGSRGLRHFGGLPSSHVRYQYS